MAKKYYLTFADGYKVIFIGTFEEMITFVTCERHGHCIECKEYRYDKHIGVDFKKIW